MFLMEKRILPTVEGANWASWNGNPAERRALLRERILNFLAPRNILPNIWDKLGFLEWEF